MVSRFRCFVRSVNLEYFWKVDDLSKICFSRYFVISSILDIFFFFFYIVTMEKSSFIY